MNPPLVVSLNLLVNLQTSKIQLGCYFMVAISIAALMLSHNNIVIFVLHDLIFSFVDLIQISSLLYLFDMSFLY